MKYVENSKNYYVCEQGFVYRNNKRLGSNKQGCYLQVQIRYLDGKNKYWFVHRLVATLYLENPENKPIVNHKDCNQQNNSVSNLEWVTHAENSKHAVANGRVGLGESSPNATLTNEQVHGICKLLQEGRRNKDVAEKFGIPIDHVSNIKAGNIWASISDQYTYPPKKRQFSDETVRWVCHLLEEGKRWKEINSINPTINEGLICNLLKKKAYKDIVKDFEFN